MKTNQLKVLFYRTEPKFADFESAVKHYPTTARSRFASEITRHCFGATILGVVASPTAVHIYLDIPFFLEIVLDSDVVNCRLDEHHAPKQGVVVSAGIDVPCKCVTRDTGYEFDWDPESVLGKLIGAKIAIVGAYTSSIYIDIGNAIALHFSRMHVEQIGSDILVYEYD